MVSNDDSIDFDALKIKVEKQIIIVLDFLMTDKQIKAKQVRKIARLVLDDLNKTTNPKELYDSFFKLLSDFPLIALHLQHTFKSLTKYVNA